VPTAGKGEGGLLKAFVPARFAVAVPQTGAGPVFAKPRHMAAPSLLWAVETIDESDGKESE
jgi:hypothetical protein